jgi:hypothetical protein
VIWSELYSLQPVAGDGGQEEREEDQRQAVLPGEAPHQWCVSPMTM